MAKKASSKYSLEQLRSKTWVDQASAERDLKRSGIALSGEDYALGEHAPGSWQLLPREGQDFDDTEVKTVASGPKPKPWIEPPTDLLNGHGVASAKPARSSRGKAGKAAAPDAAAAPATPAAPEPEPAAAEPEAAEAEAEAVPTGPLDPVPSSEGPYEVVLAEGTGVFPRHGAVAFALDVSKRFRGPVLVRNAAGVTVRTVDAEALRKARATLPKRTAATAVRKDAALSDMAQTALDWAKRKEGVKRTELNELNGGVVINWKGYLMRLGARESLEIAVNKDGPTPIYRLRK